MIARTLERALYALGMIVTLGGAIFATVAIIVTERSTGIRFPLIQYVPIAVLLISGVGFGCRIYLSLRIEREERKKANQTSEPTRGLGP